MAIVDALAGDAFIRALVIQIILPKNVNADMACMLLNNLSKHQSVSTLLLPEVLPESSTHHIDNLLELFGKEENTYNPAASYHFLGGVFANLSSCPQGCRFFLGQSTVDKTIRLSKVIMFTEHKDLIRRGGAVSTLKNVAFGVNVDAGRGLEILIDPSLNLLVYILLPLSGPEDYTDDEMEGMPEELQLLDTDKKRESDERIRHALVDTLLLMCGTLQGREYLRSLKVYDVIKKLHLQEQSEEVQETIEKLVNMLMRDEAQVDGEHDQQQR